MVTSWSRRRALAGIAGATLFPSIACARDIVELTWQDLLPEGETVIPRELRALIDHDGPNLSSEQPPSSGVRSDWNGRTVRLPGFIVPIDQRGTGITAFILVPYAGACIHVPPPPANQLVFVTAREPYESAGLYAPVNVTGVLAIATISTHLAQVGYSMDAEFIEPYRR